MSWSDLIARLAPTVRETALIFDGAKPIPRTLRGCESCGEWLMSSADRTQFDELTAAIRFVGVSPEMSGARIESSDKPDVRLHLADRIQGLEVTKIVRDGSLVGRAQWRGAVQRAARVRMRARGKPPVWVKVFWQPYPPKGGVDKVAGLLAEFVDGRLAALPDRSGRVAMHVNPHEVPEDVHAYAYSLSVARALEGTEDEWVSDFGNYPEVQPEELQAEIDRKAGRVPGFESSDGTPWLLIHADPVNEAQALDLTDLVRASSYAGPFERVFFLDCRNVTAELQMSSPSSCPKPARSQ